jgi:hypothetical protein
MPALIAAAIFLGYCIARALSHWFRPSREVRETPPGPRLKIPLETPTDNSLDHFPQAALNYGEWLGFHGYTQADLEKFIAPSDRWMPTAPAIPCNAPGCPRLKPCSEHSFDAARGTATERGYGALWRKLRYSVLFEEPVCRECLLTSELLQNGTGLALNNVSKMLGVPVAWISLTFQSMMARGVEIQRSGPPRPSSQVDHIQPKNQGGSDDRANLQGLCRHCHSAKTAKESSRWGWH